MHVKKFGNFSKWRIFSDSLLFSGKTVFLQISAVYVTGFETSSDKDANNFFVAQVVSEINAKNTSFKIS